MENRTVKAARNGKVRTDKGWGKTGEKTGTRKTGFMALEELPNPRSLCLVSDKPLTFSPGGRNVKTKSPSSWSGSRWVAESRRQEVTYYLWKHLGRNLA